MVLRQKLPYDYFFPYDIFPHNQFLPDDENWSFSRPVWLHHLRHIHLTFHCHHECHTSKMMDKLRSHGWQLHVCKTSILSGSTVHLKNTFGHSQFHIIINQWWQSSHPGVRLLFGQTLELVPLSRTPSTLQLMDNLLTTWAMTTSGQQTYEVAVSGSKAQG